MRDDAVATFDFLVGFTIFIIAFIFVAAMIPHTLFSVQSSRIDYDAVAYRTGVILTEDPGMPASPTFPVWEQKADPGDVIRMGLSVEQGSAHILSKGKVERFFNDTFFTYPDDYRRSLLFGDYPYSFNITLTMRDNLTLFDNRSIHSIGQSPPDLYGSVRRVVVVKEPSRLEVDGYVDQQFNYTGNGTPPQRFSVDLPMSQLLDRSVDPLFRIDPRTDPIQIEIGNFQAYLNNSDKATLDQVIIARDNVPITFPSYDIWLDGNDTPATLPASLNTSLNFTLYPVPETPWRLSDTISITFDFAEEGEDPPATLIMGTHVYDYRNATFPDPKQGIIEVAVW
ncbi:MAG: hypothetical protein XE11_1923 [Methanomicrobiales archaeon 53_19]|uniref:hypothetical protein n=1 Tax=Methanocalculus sp. TaxID=2004547 RepID=UPI000746F977|nr:hypothetical protein [Methanocalculus sp.]KUL02023.1 MAG: hypothetical protein XE11_1923 [Methanomicrobiales archaeon 53_19]HIJ06392.1 hypothetical protein [Methanocalculus sp.]